MGSDIDPEMQSAFILEDEGITDAAKAKFRHLKVFDK